MPEVYHVFTTTEGMMPEINTQFGGSQLFCSYKEERSMLATIEMLDMHTPQTQPYGIVDGDCEISPIFPEDCTW